MKGLHRQRWVKAFNFENDPELLSGYQRWAARIGVSVTRIREVILAARKHHANEVGPTKLGDYAKPPTMTWLAEAAGVPRHQARLIWDSILDVGFFESGTFGSFRPAQALLDETFAWETAKKLLDAIPEPEGGGRSVPTSGRSDTATVSIRPPRKEGSGGRSVPVAARKAAPNARSGHSREAPEKSKVQAGHIDREGEAATASQLSLGPRTTQTTPDPTDGRPALRWPDGPLCRLCGGALDAEALESGDPAIRGYCPTCRNF